VTAWRLPTQRGLGLRRCWTQTLQENALAPSAHAPHGEGFRRACAMKTTASRTLQRTRVSRTPETGRSFGGGAGATPTGVEGAA
jgi:hypothetical protein